MKKIIIIIIITIIVITFCLSLTSCSRYDTTGSEVTSTYHMDDNNQFVANIPIDQYLYEPEIIDGESIFNIRDYGASEDNTIIANRDAIQNAINAASEAIGGVVLVDGGVFKTTSIELKSNLTLRITDGSVLSNVTYDENKALDKANRISSYGFIYANDKENIIIEGPGKVWGNGATYCKEAEDSSKFLPLNTFNLKTYILEHRKRIMMGREDEFNRSYMFGMVNCDNVTFRNIELYEASAWTSRLEGMNNLLIEHLIINNNVNVANSDGFDIEGGSNIIIRRCFIATGDDALCIKTDKDAPPLNGILIENCEVMSLANCFKIGTGTWEEVTDVTLRNCFFFNAGITGGYTGIAIESVDGGNINDINIDNITMENIISPLVIWLGYRNNSGKLENITISNITATNCDLPCAITGYRRYFKTNYVKNVTLTNFHITYREADEDLNIYGNSEGAYEGYFNMGGYPEITRVSHRYIINHSISNYWDLPVYGLFARHVDGLSVVNFSVTPRSVSTLPMNNVSDNEERIDVKNVTWS